MRPSRLVLALAVVSACSEQPSTAPALAPAKAALDFTNGPDDPNPMIVRSADDQQFLFLNDDRDAGLFSVIGIPTAPADIVPCGGAQPLDPRSIQLVFHASGAVNMVLKGRALHADLYPRRAFIKALNIGGPCFAIATLTPIYQGLTDIDYHDNDAFSSGVHVDAFGFSARGDVTNAGGTSFRYQNEYHGTLAPDGTLLHYSSTITLR